MKRSGRLLLALALALVAAGCGGDDEILVPESIRVVPQANNQSAPVGALLPEPLAVEVLTAGGAPAVRARVRWSILSGAGSLRDTVSVVGGDGRAIVSLRLSATAGPVRIGAALVERSDRSAELNARGVSLAVVTGVQPQDFAGGDTVTISGTGLSAVDGVEFGGVRTGVLGASSTSVTAVAPVCLVPGAMTVTVLQGGVASIGVAGTYVATGGIAGLARGQYASIPASAVPSCLVFPAGGTTGSEYLMVVQSVTGTPGVTASYRLRGDTATPVTVIPQVSPAAPTTAQTFHDALRSMEEGFSRSPRIPGPSLSASVPQPAVKVGQTRNFRVCSKVGCMEAADFALVEAEAVFVGDRMILYQDRDAPSGGFTEADFATFGDLLDQRLYRVATGAFGAESDTDGNGRVVILFTPVVNRLTPSVECHSAVFTGFFFGIDIDPSFANDVRSNKGEVFYALTADPSGTEGCAISLESVRRLVPVTFVHELQHMISYNQHVLLRGGSKEVLWLDEALSHMSEELAALDFLNSGDQESFSQFASGDFGNLYLYLRSPTSFFALASEGTGSLEERGAGWWFLRWVMDHFGNGNPRSLVETVATGASNIEALTGEPMERLLTEWALATYVSDLSEFAAPERLRFDRWSLRSIYQGFHQQSPGRFPVPFPIVPPVFGGAFSQVTGAVRSGSGDYFRLVQAPQSAGFAISLTNGTGGPIDPLAGVRLNVVRIR